MPYHNNRNSNNSMNNVNSRTTRSSSGGMRSGNCGPGMHWMAPSNGKPGYCMSNNDSSMGNNGGGNNYNRNVIEHKKPLRMNNPSDVNRLKRQGKRLVTNTRHINAGLNNGGNQSYGMGGGYGSGGITPQSYCPPSCPPGECCIPGHYTSGEVVGGMGMGGRNWHPAGCGPCGGGSRNRAR